MAGVFRNVPTLEGCFAFGKHHPVASFNSGGIAGALLLFFHLLRELCFVNSDALFATDELCEVEGETVSVEEGERLFAVKHGATCLLRFSDERFEEVDTCSEGAEEAFFFFLHHARDERFLSSEFGINISHFSNKRRQEFVHEGFALTEEGVSVTHSAAENTTNDIACLGI